MTNLIIDPNLLEHLDDDTAVLALDAASDNDRLAVRTEIELRGLNL